MEIGRAPLFYSFNQPLMQQQRQVLQLKSVRKSDSSPSWTASTTSRLALKRGAKFSWRRGSPSLSVDTMPSLDKSSAVLPVPDLAVVLEQAKGHSE